MSTNHLSLETIPGLKGSPCALFGQHEAQAQRKQRKSLQRYKAEEENPPLPNQGDFNGRTQSPANKNNTAPARMQITAFVSVFVLASSQLVASQLLGRSCGFKIASCPDDMYCHPDSDDCTNMDTCPGWCTWKNTYPSCGGFRINPGPEPCDTDTEDCKDDPRNPTSCGMACDAPGICLPKKQPRCNPRNPRGCPKGLYCYRRPTRGVGWSGAVKGRDLEKEKESDEEMETESEKSFWLGICL